MKYKRRFDKRDKIVRRSIKVGDEQLTMTDEERDRQIAELIDKGMKAVNALDPIMRETFRDDPEKLAEWDEIMHMADDPDEEQDSDKQPRD